MTFVADDAQMFEMMEEGIRLVDRAEQWIAQNPYAWKRIVNKAANYAAQERHFSIARLVEDVRYEMRLDGVDDFKVNNDFRAVFARKLQKYPMIAPYIETRASKTDGLI